MNKSELTSKLANNAEYKFVADLAQGFFALGPVMGLAHPQLAVKAGLADPDITKPPAYVHLHNPDSFRAGNLVFKSGQLILDSASTSFNKYMPTEKEFRTIVAGDAQLVFSE